MVKKFTGWKEDEMELSGEIIKMYNLPDGETAEVMGTSVVAVRKMKRGQMNASPEQIKRLLGKYGIGELRPPKKSTEKEKRMYAAITTLLKYLYRAMH